MVLANGVGAVRFPLPGHILQEGSVELMIHGIVTCILQVAGCVYCSTASAARCQRSGQWELSALAALKICTCCLQDLI
jgi:hypothetical protein